MKSKFFKMLAIIAKRCNTELMQFELPFYEEELGDNWDVACKGLESFWKKNSGKYRLPSAYDIKGEINPSFASDSDIAQGIVSRTYEAQRFGYNHEKEAREYMGEVAYKAVCGNGGWRHICHADESEQADIRKQLYWTVKALINLKRDDMLDKVQTFESIENKSDHKKLKAISFDEYNEKS